MTRILFAASDLQASGPAKLFSLLLPELPKDRFQVGLLDLAGAAHTAYLEGFRRVDVPVWKTPFGGLSDFRGVRQVLQVVSKFQPDILHVGGWRAANLAGLMALPMVGGKSSPKFVASGVDAFETGLTGWWQQRAAANISRFVAPTHAEAKRYLTQGIGTERIVVIPPAVSVRTSPIDGLAFRKSLGLPQTARFIVAAGRFDSVAGMKSAVWAFDVVKYVSPDMYLLMVGDGPERDRLTRFAQALGYDDHRVKFLGTQTDLPEILRHAELVWVTHARGGTNVTLEAMAAGIPVVAVQTDDLKDILLDGNTGRFVRQEDRVQLAAVSNELLESPTTLQTLGTAARDRAQTQYPTTTLSTRFATLYETLHRPK
ncbi:MAG: glycosyltransferase [Fimbriiglobus sp.]